MIVRLGFLVAASIAAYAVKQHNIRASRSTAPLIKPSGNNFNLFVFTNFVHIFGLSYFYQQ
uniref:Uncharacterized protein MANES_06G073200 n=1 Tax=Rhizophora mucronata TaxID=61149 RepID=A0A2P2JA87_RHIMU